MSQVIRNGAIVADDWQLIEETATIQAGTQVIVPLGRWRSERGSLDPRTTGVLLSHTDDVDAIHAEIADRPVLALQFPVFSDGRALSQARVLRGRLGFRGELRAVGDILRDQMFGLQRCGFDVIVPRADQDLADCVRALHEFNVVYQPAADGATTIWQQRRAAGA